MSAGEFLLYQTEDGRTRVECRFADETLWLSQADMAALFQTSKQNVAKHLKAIFGEGELDADSVVNQWLTTAADGKAYRVAHYSLEAILAVGYRVRSVRGTQFRRWATERLGEYLLKGFTMDDMRWTNTSDLPKRVGANGSLKANPMRCAHSNRPRGNSTRRKQGENLATDVENSTKH